MCPRSRSVDYRHDREDHVSVDARLAQFPKNEAVMPTVRQLLIVILGLLFLTVAAAAPAAADPWGVQSSSTGAHPDGSTHNWCWGSGFDLALRDNVIDSMNNALGGPTDAVVDYKSTCVLSGLSETDVVWFDADLPGSTRGKAPCEDYDGSYCDQFYVTLDPAQINIGSNDEADTTKTTCHELGHTVGLTHGAGGGDGTADDCMVSGERPSSATRYERYSTHHKGHINAWF